MYLAGDDAEHCNSVQPSLTRLRWVSWAGILIFRGVISGLVAVCISEPHGQASAGSKLEVVVRARPKPEPVSDRILTPIKN